jgi:hypothetical protein
MVNYISAFSFIGGIFFVYGWAFVCLLVPIVFFAYHDVFLFYIVQLVVRFDAVLFRLFRFVCLLRPLCYNVIKS